MEYEPEITIVVHPEHAPIQGNVLASGDDAEDQKAERWVLDQLESGNPWAWCCVEVRASFRGLTASDFLGCVSATSEEDFRTSGYLEDMIQVATEELRDQIEELQGCEIKAVRPNSHIARVTFNEE